MGAIADHLRQVPLFEGLTDRVIEAVAAVARETRFDDDESLIREGEPGDGFFVIVDGRVRVSRGGEPVSELGPGDFLGEISLVDNRPRTASAVAAGPVGAIVVDRASFLKLVERVGSARLGILTTLTDRIRRDSAG